MIEMMRLRSVVCALFVLAMIPAFAVAQDSAAARNGFWSIDLKVRALRMISPKTGAGAGSLYWYMLYELNNNTGQDRDVYINVTATTDGKRKYADLYLPAVERAAEVKERREFWGKIDQFKVLATRDPKDPKYNYFTVKAGETKRCIAVFNRFDPTGDRIKIHVAGLAGAIEQKTRDDGARVLIERLRQLSFVRHGDEFAVGLDRFRLKDQRWIKREVNLASAERSGI